MLPAKIDEYVRPATIEEALAAIAKYGEGDGMFLAGGQSLMQAIKSRMIRPRCIIDLQAIDALRGITIDDGLSIGAMTRYVEIAEFDALPPAYAALADAASHVGDRQVRNRGTIGGSVCWNYVASCMPAVVLGTGATMHLVSGSGSRRTVAASEFIISPFETAREDGEMLVSLSWPPAPAKSGSAYKKWGLVTDALPVIGMCISVALDTDNRCSSATVAVAGLSDGAQLVPAGGAALTGTDGSDEAIAAALDAVVDAVDTHDDQWASANYRQQLIRNIGSEVAGSAFARARG